MPKHYYRHANKNIKLVSHEPKVTQTQNGLCSYSEVRLNHFLNNNFIHRVRPLIGWWRLYNFVHQATNVFTDSHKIVFDAQ